MRVRHRGNSASGVLSVIPVVRNVWQPIAVSMLALTARRCTIYQTSLRDMGLPVSVNCSAIRPTRCCGSRPTARPVGQSRECAAAGDGIDRRTGCPVESRGRHARFRFLPSQRRALPGVESAFDVSEARRANRAIARRKAQESTAAPARAGESRWSPFRFGASQPRAPVGAGSAFDLGEARRAVARSRGRRHRRRSFRGSRLG